MLLLGAAGPAQADRGAIPFQPEVTIFEPTQRALIAWNGEEEILILSTDLRASRATKVLEVIAMTMPCLLDSWVLFNNPRNVGTLDKSAAEVGTGLVGAPECGDVMRLQIRVNPETQVIEEAKFKTFGCGSAIASSSLATEWIKGRTVDDALGIKNTDIVKELSLPPVKIHCSVLAEDAIRAAIGDWKKKNNVAELPSREPAK